MRNRTVHCIAIAIFLVPAVFAARAEYNPLERSSVRNESILANADSYSPQITMNSTGRYVVFESAASNLVSGDTNGEQDVFRRDRTSKETVLVSANSAGNFAHGSSGNASMSVDGNLVVFESTGTDIVSGDSNNAKDIFLRNMITEETIRVSVNSAENQSNGDSTEPVVSGDGNFVAFASEADNLVAGDSNGASDIFVRDVVNGTTERVSVKSDSSEAGSGSYNPSISEDGRYVVFESDATNLVNGDVNQSRDIFLHDRNTATTVRVSVSATAQESDGSSSQAVISLDGTRIVYQSEATNIVAGDTNGASDVFLYTVADGSVARLSDRSVGGSSNGASSHPVLSDDGLFVAFESEASDLVSGDSNGTSDIFVYNTDDSLLVRVSVTATSRQVNGSSISPSLNSNGNFVSFASDSTGLISGDTNDAIDIFTINAQCLLTPPGVTPLDTDGDLSDDCTDECPTDVNKVIPGTCGCGEEDVDSDSDGTLDCEDACPTDGDKIAVGVCGCGESDSDDNGNGVADCLDPTSDSLPLEPFIVRKRRGVIVLIPSQFASVRYRIVVRRDGQLFKKRTTESPRLRLRKLRSGRYRVFYRVILPEGGASRRSAVKRFRIR